MRICNCSTAASLGSRWSRRGSTIRMRVAATVATAATVPTAAAPPTAFPQAAASLPQATTTAGYPIPPPHRRPSAAGESPAGAAAPPRPRDPSRRRQPGSGHNVPRGSPRRPTNSLYSVGRTQVGSVVIQWYMYRADVRPSVGDPHIPPSTVYRTRHQFAWNAM